jgi:protein phosphatase
MPRFGKSSLIGRRESQQDAAVVMPLAINEQHALFAVLADGAGGQGGGDLAARIGVSWVIQSVVLTLIEAEQSEQQLDSDSIAAMLAHAVIHANQQVNARKDGAHARMASTLTVALVHDGRLVLLWAGDSPAFCYRNAKAIPLTLDHTLAELDVRDGLVRRGDFGYRRNSHCITRYLGQSPEAFGYDLRVVALQPEDVIVLTSDGVDAHPAQIKVMEAVRSGRLDAPSAAHLLTCQSIDRGSTDNCTAIVMVPDVPAPTRTPAAPTLVAGYPTELALAAGNAPKE